MILGLQAGELASAARPGQFVMAIPQASGFAATALGIYEASGERASVMVVTAGPRTAELAALACGDRLELLGPLGNGFDLTAVPSSIGIVAGGVGLASVLLAAERCVAAGAGTTLYYGARTAAALVDRNLFAAAGCEVVVATDDGSEGHRGFVTDLLRSGPMPDLLLACGPSSMLRAVGAIAHERGVAAQLSLEETFACGVGACWGCVVPIDRTSLQAPHFPPASPREPRLYANARVCKEGPVFWSTRAAMVTQTVPPSLRTTIGKLDLAYPTLMGSGCYGSGEEYGPFIDLAKIGGVVLKSVTRDPRLGNQTPRLVHTPGGMLNAIGLQNPGIEYYLEHEVEKFASRPCAVIGSVAGFSVDDYAYVTERLAARDEIDAIEVNISCPNVASEGETFACDPKLASAVVRKCRAATAKTLIVKLSPNVTDIAGIAHEVEGAGADALAVINTVRGMSIDVDRWAPRLGNVTGGLSGPDNPADRSLGRLRGRPRGSHSHRPTRRDRELPGRARVLFGRRNCDIYRNGELHRSPRAAADRGGA